MKKNIHPKYYDAQIECACGKKFNIGSTKEKMAVEICSNCHPFYTGKEKLVDAAGRVEKFRARLAVGQARAAAHADKQTKTEKTGAPKKTRIRKPRGTK